MILVTGGTGFIGQVLIRHLVSLGYPVRSLIRPSQQTPNLPKGVTMEVAVCSLRDERGLRAAMKGVEVVYHLAGSERQGNRADLETVDVYGTQAVARAAAAAGVERILTLSHLGADSNSAYPVFKAKAYAEKAIQQSGVDYTILRSGLVFGPRDAFTTRLARLLRISPGIFLLPANGEVKLQPIWVEDLATCLTWALDKPDTRNQVIPLGGVDVLTFRQVVETVMQFTGHRRHLMSLSPAYLRGVTIWCEHMFPSFPVSVLWLDYLAADRTCNVDTAPRVFGLMPARFTQCLGYLQDPIWSQPRNLSSRSSI